MSNLLHVPPSYCLHITAEGQRVDIGDHGGGGR